MMISPQQQPQPSGFSFDDLDDLIMEDDVDHDHEGARNCDDELDSVSHLFKTQKYSDIMHNLEVAFQRESNDNDYQLIVDCNALSVDIDNEIVAVHNFIRDKYRLKFPELESIVRHSIDYAGVVKKIGNEMDLTLVNLEGLLPSVTIMLVSIMASTTTGKPLPENVLEETIDACDRVFAEIYNVIIKIQEWTSLVVANQVQVDATRNIDPAALESGSSAPGCGYNNQAPPQKANEYNRGCSSFHCCRQG
ncbi:hypothetical protein EZV62_000769 [Acer yangbiense]|uniref:NOSIC domain-containing protein n=1 Tax=Acer yangbiense TaxID=1000413 RepID=A0A5C7IS76_9ROSI|nr:hypothetical protein EZV62_000769 [Acer yangbiense]